MSNTTIQIRKSGIPGSIPSSLNFGELALNYADGALYYKTSSGTITRLSSGTSGSNTTNSFSTINANSSLILASSPYDILSIQPGNNITITGSSGSKTITIDTTYNLQNLYDSIIYNTGVDLTQNANISYAITLAQAAYNQANTGTGTSTLDQYARDTANSASANSIYNAGVDLTQNAEIQYAITLAQDAYNQANTGGGSGSLYINNDNSSNNVKYITFANNYSGTTNTLEADANNLVYFPSTGLLGVNSVSLTPNTNISVKTQTFPNTAQTLFDSIDTNAYRGAFYEIQIENGPEFHMLNMMVGQNSVDAYYTIYGEVYSSSSLGSFSANVSSGLLNVYFTPVISSTVVSNIRKVIARQTNVPTGDLGYVTQQATIFFDAGYVDQPAGSSYDYGYV